MNIFLVEHRFDGFVNFGLHANDATEMWPNQCYQSIFFTSQTDSRKHLTFLYIGNKIEINFEGF